MSPRPSVLVLGGGLSGMAAAYTLAEAGATDVTIVERGTELGGLAGTFERDGSFYPLAYHHILHRDRALLFFLDRIGAISDVRWRKIRMLFRLDDGFYDLAHPLDFARFPRMGLVDKLRFARLMVRAFGKDDWSDWDHKSAAELVDGWASPGVRQALFEPLARLKFDRRADELSGEWLGKRLHFREGSAPLGYIPDTNWTKVLCDGITRLLAAAGVTVRLATTVTKLETEGERIVAAVLDSGERLAADRFVSTVPTEVYVGLVPGDRSPELSGIRYTAIISAICATRQKIAPEFYWMNVFPADHQAGGIFMLDSLNPTIGAPGDRSVNFITHLPSRTSALFQRSDDEILSGYFADFRRIFGFAIEPFWSRVLRLGMYSPTFLCGYKNPPVRSASYDNVYFAGNYRTFPSIASTGTALESGVEGAAALLADDRAATGLAAAIAAYRLRRMPRG